MTVLDNQNNQNYQNGFLIYNKDFIFKGKFLSSEQFKIAEICFNTSMTGYQEILTGTKGKAVQRIRQWRQEPDGIFPFDF